MKSTRSTEAQFSPCQVVLCLVLSFCSDTSAEHSSGSPTDIALISAHLILSPSFQSFDPSGQPRNLLFHYPTLTLVTFSFRTLPLSSHLSLLFPPTPFSVHLLFNLLSIFFSHSFSHPHGFTPQFSILDLFPLFSQSSPSLHRPHIVTSHLFSLLLRQPLLLPPFALPLCLSPIFALSMSFAFAVAPRASFLQS